MIKVINDVSKQLTDRLKTRKLTKAISKSKYYKMESANNPNVFIGLMYVED